MCATVLYSIKYETVTIESSKNWFGPLAKIMEYRCLGLSLLELKRHREKLLKENNATRTTRPHRTIMKFL
jgi:hypothetical protein